MDKKKVFEDIECAIDNLSKIRIDLIDMVGVLNRTLVEIEGIENFWTEDLTDYQKVEKAIKKGFTIKVNLPYEPEGLNGLIVNYLGYHFWGLTDEEIKSLKDLQDDLQLSKKKGGTTTPRGIENQSVPDD